MTTVETFGSARAQVGLQNAQHPSVDQAQLAKRRLSMGQDAPARTDPRYKARRGGRLIGNIMQGVGLIASTGGGAVLAFGATLTPEHLLYCAAASAAMVVLGLVVFVRAERGADPDVCFDPEAREVRVVCSQDKGHETVLLRRHFESLGGVRLGAGNVVILERDGSVLLELPLQNRRIRAALRETLSGEIPILS